MAQVVVMPQLGNTVESCLITTWLVARGAEESSRTTLILTIVQYGGLALFAVIMIIIQIASFAAVSGTY